MPLDQCVMQQVTTQNTIGCYQQVCHMSPDGTKNLCEPTICPIRPAYVCRREDGTEYVWQQEFPSGSTGEIMPLYNPYAR